MSPVVPALNWQSVTPECLSRFAPMQFGNLNNAVPHCQILIEARVTTCYIARCLCNPQSQVSW